MKQRPQKEQKSLQRWKRVAEKVDKARAWDAVAEKNAEIERLKGLLADKQYIQCLADYNKGHLSHAGWLAAREKQPPKRDD